MTVTRNLDTEFGREMWRKIDLVAKRAPAWALPHVEKMVKEHRERMARSEAATPDAPKPAATI